MIYEAICRIAPTRRVREIWIERMADKNEDFISVDHLPTLKRHLEAICAIGRIAQ